MDKPIRTTSVVSRHSAPKTLSAFRVVASETNERESFSLHLSPTLLLELGWRRGQQLRAAAFNVGSRAGGKIVVTLELEND